MNKKELQQRMQFARTIAVKAGDLTMQYYRSARLTVKEKRAFDPVTQADLRAEKLLRKEIKKAYPQDGIIGEEFGEQKGSTSYTWVLDPLDGTVFFVHGVPMFGTMVSLVNETESIMSVIHMPAVGETAYAAKGLGAYWQVGNKKQLAKVSTTGSLKEATVVGTSFNKRNLNHALPLFRSAGVVRGWGGCFGIVRVAIGKSDAQVDPCGWAHLWDVAAYAPIITEAGGWFGSIDGNQNIFEVRSYLASNKKLASRILPKLK